MSSKRKYGETFSDENSEPTPRTLPDNLMMSSTQIQRHSEFAMILLIGSTGSGKSSTINHFLNIGGETLAAKTSDDELAAKIMKKTSEYIITFPDPKYDVRDLVLSVIDTPGFNDGDGAEQDACNFVSIKKYFDTHPKFPSNTKIYPNLVFMVEKASNIRMRGVNSIISKSLRGIKMLEMVDTTHSNLVVILTHVCSVDYNNTKKWQETMQKKKKLVSDIVFETLGVMAPVVLIENNPNNDHELQKDGNYTILPNGETQPLNLYNDCLSLLKKSGDGYDKIDKFGQMVLNNAFTQKKKDLRKSHEVEAKNAKEEPLSKLESKFANDFIQGFDKYMDSNDSSQLKPLPSSNDEIKKELNKSIEMDEEQNPRALLLYFLISSVEIQRPSQSAMILLVGSTGSGKSSTINHLLDTGDGIPVAETNKYESSTKKTSEYIITFDEPEYEVSDLVLSVIDTPGLNDGDGVEQDACNFVSIKKYLETHPEFSSKTKIYPNLVFIVDRVNNNRIKGVNSTLSKSLRGVKMLDVVDISHPNLVVILTHACSVGYKNVRKWHEAMQEMKNFVSDLVFQILGVRAPVVLIENNPDDYGLEKNGDFTILPNGERQPLNLYNACLSLLTKSKDRKEKRDQFGHVVLNAAFKQKKNNRLTNGYEVKAKIAGEEPLSDVESKLVKDFSEAARKGFTNSLVLRATQYISECNIQEESVKKELLELVVTMNSMGLSDDSKLRSITISEINCRHGDDITEHGLQMLEKKFGIKCAKSFFQAEFIGQGYNLVTDDFVSSRVLKLSLVDNKQFGFKIPEFAQILKSNETVVNEIHLHRNESSIKSRLQALRLNVSMTPSILKMVPELDVNLSMERQKNDLRSLTNTKMLIEVRLAKINVGEFDLTKISFDDVFRSAVNNLPSKNIEDEKVMKEFVDFFNRFGQFIVTSAYVGGSVECDSRDDKMELSNEDENSIGGGIGAYNAKISGERQASANQERKNFLKTASTKWKGGRLDLQVEEKFSEWKTSVANDPVFLKNILTLQPIYDLVGMIDEKKGNLTKDAFQKIFQIDISSLYNNDLSETNLQMETREEDQEIRNSNTRLESTREPDSSGFRNMYDILKRLLSFIDVFDVYGTLVRFIS